MKHIFLSLLFFCAISVSAQSSVEIHDVEKSVFEFFEGLSASDLEKMKKYATSDIKLIENGQVWTMDTLARFASVRKPADYKRINTLKFIETVVKGNIAWSSYYNQADITSNGRAFVRKWMESTVLIKEDEDWKIRLLHSTPDK